MCYILSRYHYTLGVNMNASPFPENSILIASYPRSGNTWMRLVLSDIILQLHDLDTKTYLPVHSDKVIPDFDANPQYTRWKYLQTPHVFLKTHKNFTECFRKSVYIVRRPEDSLCSFYHFHLRYDHLKGKVSDGLDKFAVNFGDKWANNVQSFIDGRQYKDILFISYEMMHQSPFDTFKKVSKFIGLSPTDEMIKIAVENHTFEKQTSNESLEGTQYNSKFFRQGKILASLDEFQMETIQEIREKWLPYYVQAKQLENSFTSFHK